MASPTRALRKPRTRRGPAASVPRWTTAFLLSCSSSVFDAGWHSYCLQDMCSGVREVANERKTRIIIFPAFDEPLRLKTA